MRETIESAGATLVYLPPDSPDLNPIEMVFYKLKWLVRGASLRNIERLWSFFVQALDHFSPDERLHYLQHCGYATDA